MTASTASRRSGSRCALGNRERDPGRLDLGLGAGQATLHGLLGDQERPGDLGGLQATEGPQRERHLPVQRQRRVAAGEDQLEPLVLDHGVVELVHDGLRHRQQVDLLGQGALPADPVDRPVAGRRHQPRARVGRHARHGPALRRDRERLLRGVLGLVEVTEEPDQRGQHPAPLVAEDLLQHGQRCTTGLTSTAPPNRAAGMRAASSIASSRLRRLDQAEAAEHLLGVRERAVGHQRPAADHPHAGRRLGRLQLRAATTSGVVGQRRDTRRTPRHAPHRAAPRS